MAERCLFGNAHFGMIKVICHARDTLFMNVSYGDTGRQKQA
ncbi:hypothetical protein SAMN04488244_11222 [Vibrio hangzhouensis]|uniref:Uncharacterized protein n=1 Tax=Vibrio hangzhouensis TaxID=462991 RepID=A0A1H5ZJN5_9VIBR|nr:hypothetical protein SAMN04488244_11222 [Vibrio hangzhouensis]